MRMPKQGLFKSATGSIIPAWALYKPILDRAYGSTYAYQYYPNSVDYTAPLGLILKECETHQSVENKLATDHSRLLSVRSGTMTG